MYYLVNKFLKNSANKKKCKYRVKTAKRFDFYKVLKTDTAVCKVIIEKLTPQVNNKTR